MPKNKTPVKTPKATKRKGPPPAANGAPAGGALPTEKGETLVVAAPAVPASAAPSVKKVPAKRTSVPKKSPAEKTPAKKVAAPTKAKQTSKAAKPSKPSAPKKRAASRNKGKKRGWAEKLLKANEALLGTVSDQVVSTRLGMSAEAVRQYRIAHDIPSLSAGGPVVAKKAAGKPPAANAAAPTAKATAPAKKPPPAAAAKSAAAPKGLRGPGAKSTCWRVSVRDAEPVYVMETGLAAAATRVEKALGDAATGLEVVGPAIG